MRARPKGGEALPIDREAAECSHEYSRESSAYLTGTFPLTGGYVPALCGRTRLRRYSERRALTEAQHRASLAREVVGERVEGSPRVVGVGEGQVGDPGGVLVVAHLHGPREERAMRRHRVAEFEE